jgi:small subunit ribosomal protein S7
MPRRAEIAPRTLLRDPVYDSTLVAQVINRVMLDGKKSTAEHLVYGALDIVGEKTGQSPVEVLERAIKSVTPVLEVRSRRVGGANYQVPIPVKPKRQLSLSIRWIIAATRSKSGRPMSQRLADELLAASRREGEAMSKRENTIKMADANKAFSHFAW